MTRQEESTVVLPQKRDVVCGRDKFSQGHVGNQRFRQVIEQYRVRYQNAPCRTLKTRITLEIIQTMRKEGGRFLKWDTDTHLWYDVGDDCAKEKVSHALRSAKDPLRPRIRKKRKKKAPSKTKSVADSPSETFRRLLALQRKIFRQLVLEQNRRMYRSSRNEVSLEYN